MGERIELLARVDAVLNELSYKLYGLGATGRLNDAAVQEIKRLPSRHDDVGLGGVRFVGADHGVSRRKQLRGLLRRLDLLRESRRNADIAETFVKGLRLPIRHENIDCLCAFY